MRVVIVGAGWAGAAAAIAARKQGAEVLLAERTDMLLGCGLVGGIMRNNGRFTAAEEMLAMEGGELFKITDEIALHRGIDFPGTPPRLPLQCGHRGADGQELPARTRGAAASHHPDR